MQEYDFYFSEKMKKHLIEFKKKQGKNHRETFFNSKEYTEGTPKGKTPISNHFGDLVFIGTGTLENITLKH